METMKPLPIEPLPNPDPQTEPLVRAGPPATTLPAPPLGATYEPKATKMDGGSYHEMPTKELGPEFPMTPSARGHTVTEERLPGKAVIDRGTSPEETGPDVPSDESAAPRP